MTAAYHVVERQWTNLAPAHTPPPVLGGTLAYDPVNDEMVLYGGGRIAEAGPDGRIDTPQTATATTDLAGDDLGLLISQRR